MSEEVPLAAQIEKVRRELRYAYAQEGHAPKAERLWSAVLATLQQHERAMAEMEAAYQNCAELAMTYHGRLERAMAVVDQQANDDGLWFAAQTAPEAYLQQELRKLHAAIERATLDDATSAAATPAGKGET